MRSAGLDRLIAAYDDPDACVATALAAGRRPIRTLGSDAPRELLVAAGFQPIRLETHAPSATPRADGIVGAQGLGPRGRRLLERILDADRHVPVLITAADVEQTQLFGIARELARSGAATTAPLFLLDLRHQPRAATERYNRVRLEELTRWLERQGGIAPDDSALGDAFAMARRSKALLDALAALRGEGRVAGATALKIIGSATILHAEEHRAALAQALAHLRDAPVRTGPRVFLAGSAHEDAALYAAIERNGATIVGESHAWGTPSTALPDAALAGVAAIADPLLRAAPAGIAGSAIAAETLRAAAAAGATHLLHLTIDGDEAAPWDVAALRARGGRALPFAALTASAGAADTLDAQIAAFLAGAAARDAALPRPASAPRRPPPRDPASRSRKALASVGDFGAYQRDWFADVRRRVAEGAPFAIVNANAPQEILRALDIPFVVNQWWASIVAAKQQSGRYLGLLAAHGYPTRAEPYSAQGLAAAFDDDAAAAPWGGLPRPDFIHAVQSSDATAKLFDAWAEATGARRYLYERTVDPRWTISTRWWEELPDRWDEALEPARLDLLTAELAEVIAMLERETGRTLDRDRLVAVLDLVNEQEDYYRRTRDLIARTVPAPIGIVDSMPATMVPQWHRGTVWGRDAAKAFHDEVAARVRDGLAAVPGERVRLMFVGRGLWSEMGFYQRWEESHGAVFVWSMYLALAADGYIRRHDRGRDPLRALAARFLTMGDELRMPSWAAPWHVHEAQTHQVDGAVAVDDADPFVLRALEQAGVPVLALGVDNFNREGADAAAIDARVAAFIEGPAGVRAAARRAA